MVELTKLVFVTIIILITTIDCLEHLECNPKVCANKVSKCLLTKYCVCGDFANNFTCAKDCTKCLGSLYQDCCSCLGIYLCFYSIINLSLTFPRIMSTGRYSNRSDDKVEF